MYKWLLMAFSTLCVVAACACVVHVSANCGGTATEDAGFVSDSTLLVFSSSQSDPRTAAMEDGFFDGLDKVSVTDYDRNHVKIVYMESDGIFADDAGRSAMKEHLAFLH